eukprot:TRINITY_DN15784_c0_g1_i2.p1 TRINITY_DN15784_c0_g1~~TRINITY_DN15784_c0_g1_i2.p1  ORF type:complete len:363 (+),score=48.58 TRINITY_DN15784_c0_g1_i2:3-1091(+)
MRLFQWNVLFAAMLCVGIEGVGSEVDVQGLLSEIFTKLNDMQSNQASMQSMLVDMKRDQVDMKRDLVDMKRDQVDMKRDLVDMKRDQVFMQSTLDDVRRDQVSMQSTLDDVRSFVVKRRRLLARCTYPLSASGAIGTVSMITLDNQTFYLTGRHNDELVFKNEQWQNYDWCGHPALDLMVSPAPSVPHDSVPCAVAKPNFEIGEEVVAYSPLAELSMAQVARGIVVGTTKIDTFTSNTTVPRPKAPQRSAVVNVPLFGGYSGSGMSNGEWLGLVVSELACVDIDELRRVCGVVIPAAAIATFIRDDVMRMGCSDGVTPQRWRWLKTARWNQTYFQKLVDKGWDITTICNSLKATLQQEGDEL